jgi:adenylate cyclase
VGIEIERKFLVVGDEWRQEHPARLSQGYLSRAKERTVRVRLAGEHAFLTIKGATTGATRAEFEYEIPLSDAEQMLRLCDGPVIEKFRHVLTHQGVTWEIDEFFGENQGLVVAEVELKSEDQKFEKPKWLGQEVTSDSRYFNSNLSSRPYNTW